MKILTIQQPWASLIAVGEKTVENRRWATSYRGPLAIHAGKGTDKAGLKDPYASMVGHERGLDFTDLPAGVIVAVAELVDVHESEGDCCVPWGFGHGWQHLLLEQIRPVRTPIAYVGQLGLRELDPDVAAELAGELLAAW